MHLTATFSTSIAFLAAVASTTPIEEGFIGRATLASSPTPTPTPAGFNLTNVETHQPSGVNGDNTYTVAFHIADLAGETDCSISWPITAPVDAEKLGECENVTFSATVTAFGNISSFSLDLDHFYANEESNISNSGVTPNEFNCTGTVGQSNATAQCDQIEGTVIVLPGGTGFSG